MDEVELLRAVYRAIAWEKLYRIAPDASRRQVEEVFRRLGQLPERAAPPQAPPPPPASSPGPQAPGPRRARLYCDGASSGNPGPAAIGMVLCAPDGEELRAWGRPIGHATNNVAEYQALIEGLSGALELGVQEIEVFSDSQLLVFQLTGRYKVRSPALLGLHRKAQALLERFGKWRVTGIPRSQNRRADEIAAAQIKKRARARRS